MFLFQKIEETMMKYTDARHAVGEFILREPENLYQYTVTEIAAKTFTSKATVVRFAKAMGYDGWKEFMKDYIAEVKYQKEEGKCCKKRGSRNRSSIPRFSGCGIDYFLFGK